MKLYNTLSRSIEDVQPFVSGKIGLYACGPTVYDYAHIGHMRKYTMDDVLIRTLKHAGFAVTHVMNITDVGHLVSDDDVGEDKMEKGAKKYGKTVWELAKEFEAFFWKSIDAMAVNHPDVSCKATDHIAEQIALVQTLEQKGFTYVIGDGVYFDTSKFPGYGELSRLDPEHLKAGARVEMVEGKKHPTDFALWKFSPEKEHRQMEWESPWGKGFPGWHIECSAMSMKYLGEHFDIHTGGIDHIPIHHTNEIAQSEAATGKHPFVKYWVHHNFLRVNGEKMSKSLGNFYTVDDIVSKGFSPMALKLMFMGAHYRSELNFTWENIAATQTAYEKLVASLSTAHQESDRTILSDEKLQKVNEYRTKFFSLLEEDLHTPEAMSVFWEVLKSNIPGGDKYELIMEFDTVLGLKLRENVAAYESKHEHIPSGVRQLVDMRQAARDAKDFAKSDTLRDEIARFGWSVEDTASGQKVKKK
ncbi:cysteine--tRNA ligase [Candidatus Cerribacteria bacterium 'Amazon FNV 2010 28 9']|uniref:Cysteine--tRNA ligase n=1 Tax=Candidatus Cerribacteria bacterium 'Amazon FNV 2010 28 9' TaxID=2081795 RepID=A0A317JQG8_9BACT|nr:MAG: cysteine--tRNA ligase [Candidatus Cerribacteria bacterium 'Amazon FNV 2010 28 9']